MTPGQRLELLKEVGGTKVYEERRRESFRIIEEAESKKALVRAYACACMCWCWCVRACACACVCLRVCMHMSLKPHAVHLFARASLDLCTPCTHPLPDMPQHTHTHTHTCTRTYLCCPPVHADRGDDCDHRGQAVRAQC
jgi:hypothetical protein